LWWTDLRRLRLSRFSVTHFLSRISVTNASVTFLLSRLCCHVPSVTPFALNAIAFALGAWLLQQQPQLPSFLWTYALLAALFGYVLLARMEGQIAQILGRLFLPVLFLAVGFLWSAGIAHVRLADALGAEWEGRDVELIGVVADLPQSGERGVRFRFDVERVVTPLAPIPRYVSLTWYAERVSAAGSDPSQARPIPELRPGQRWELTVRLRRPHGAANPNGFDSEMAALERGIRAVGYVRSNEPSRLLADIVEHPAYWIERLRERARSRIYSLSRVIPRPVYWSHWQSAINRPSPRLNGLCLRARA